MSFLQIKSGSAPKPTGEVVVTIGLPADELGIADATAIQAAGFMAVLEAVQQLIALKGE